MGKGLTLYVLTSLLLPLVFVTLAWQRRHDFFFTTVDLCYNKLFHLVCVNMIIGLEVKIGQIIKRIVFSELSDIEYETLTDTFKQDCISMIFSIALIGGISLDFTNMTVISLILFCKFFHILCDIRRESMQQDLVVNNMKEKLLGFLIVVLIITDSCLVYVFWKYNKESPSIANIFTVFQFILLFISALYLTCQTILNFIDRSLGGNWDRRPEIVLYVDVGHTLVTLLTVAGFAYIMITKHKNMPWYLLSLAYRSFQAFKKKADLLLKFWRLSKAIDKQFPSIEMQDLPDHDSTCSICMEDMTVGRLLPCGHIIHEKCLRSWLTRQDRCPICQHPVMDPHPSNPSEPILERYKANRTRRLSGQYAAPSPSPAPAPAPASSPAEGIEHQQQQQPAAAGLFPFLGGQLRTEDIDRLINQLRALQQQLAHPTTFPSTTPAVISRNTESQEDEDNDDDQQEEDPEPPQEGDLAEIRRRRLAALSRSSSSMTSSSPAPSSSSVAPPSSSTD